MRNRAVLFSMSILCSAVLPALALATAVVNPTGSVVSPLLQKPAGTSIPAPSIASDPRNLTKGNPAAPELGSSPANCSGLQVPKGNFAVQHARRVKGVAEYCGKNGDGKTGKLKATLEDLKARLKSCEDAGTGLEKSGASQFTLQVHYDDMEERIRAGCAGYSEYVKSSQEFCDSYGAEAASTGKFALTASGYGQQGEIGNAADLASKNSAAMSKYRATVQKMGAKLNEKVKNIGQAQDDKMKAKVDSLGKKIEARMSYLRVQINNKLAARQNLDPSVYQTDRQGGTMRFTQAQYEAFKKNYQACASAVKSIPKWNEAYQKVIGVPLADMNNESKKLAGDFGERQLASSTYAKQVADSGKQLGDYQSSISGTKEVSAARSAAAASKLPAEEVKTISAADSAPAVQAQPAPGTNPARTYTEAQQNELISTAQARGWGAGDYTNSDNYARRSVQTTFVKDGVTYGVYDWRGTTYAIPYRTGSASTGFIKLGPTATSSR